MSDNYYNNKHIESVLAERDEIMVSTSGISMYPMLRHRRDMIVLTKVQRPLKKYDVPLYRKQSGKLVLHRILKVTKNGYIIRGDNLFHKEYDITDENIIAMLKGFYRNGKYYECNTHIGYKIYIRINRYTFYLRLLWSKYLRPFLSKVKHSILK